MKNILYIIVFLICVSSALALNVTLNCDWYDNTCPNNTTAYLRMNNQSANFTNGHAQLINFTDNNYSSILCCNASTLDYLIPSGPNVMPFIRLYNVTNSHIQEPAMTNYNYAGNFRTIASYVVCEYTTSCSSGYSCIYSLESDDVSNRSNAHISRCGIYPNEVCCGMVENITTGGTVPPPSGGGGGGYVPTTITCAVGEVWFNGVCVNMGATNCTWSFNKDYYAPNETIEFEFSCPGYEGQNWFIQFLDGNNTVLYSSSGIVAEKNIITWSYPDELSGLFNLEISNAIKTEMPISIRKGIDKALLWIILFIAISGIGIFILLLDIKKKNNRRKEYEAKIKT